MHISKSFKIKMDGISFFLFCISINYFHPFGIVRVRYIYIYVLVRFLYLLLIIRWRRVAHRFLRLHLGAVRLYPHLLHAAVAGEGRRVAGVARILYTQPVLRFGFLKAGAQWWWTRHRRQRRAVRADCRRRCVHRHHAAVRREHFCAGVCHRYPAGWKG